MRYDYTQLFTRDYAGEYGCLRLVADVYKDLYRITLPLPVYAPQGRAYMHSLLDALREYGKRMDVPDEGDIIFIRRWHVGVVVSPGKMVHAYETGEVALESYHTPVWRPRVQGFYRYVR